MNFTRSILALAIAGTVFISCKNTAAEATPETAKETPAVKTEKAAIVGKVETASFHIEGMSCEVMCAAKIQKELSAMEGVQKATVDFKNKTATVEYDNAKQSPERLAEKVESVADGKTYKVSDVKSSGDHAMLFQDKEKNPKKDKKAKLEEASSAPAPKAAKSKEAKAGCCAGKKHCAEKPASM